MSAGDAPKNGSFEQANSMLVQGLKSCRTVLNSYRTLLASDPSAQSASAADADPARVEAAGELPLIQHQQS